MVPQELSAEALFHRGSEELNNALKRLGDVKFSKKIDPTKQAEMITYERLDEIKKSANLREFYDKSDAPIQFKGQFLADPGFRDRYQLRVWRMNCCSADQIPQAST